MKIKEEGRANKLFRYVHRKGVGSKWRETTGHSPPSIPLASVSDMEPGRRRKVIG